MTVYEIPTTAQSQTFEITLAGVTYNLTLKWNAAANVWVLDIADQNDNKILSGIPLVTGADLLGQYKYLNLGGSLTCQTDANVDAPPTYSNLGTEGHLYFITTP